jgi:DNA mismatch repair protein MSH3
LAEHLKEIRQTVKRPTLQYVSVAGVDNLVEIPVAQAKTVPAKWVKVQA